MYLPTIGLEIHAELKTRTKMFCASANDPDETRPNVNVCQVCMAHPGTLPVINRAAVRHILRIGTAIKGTLADFSEFDRKSYFYPDIPKGYQISQYMHPLVVGGELSGVTITRVHLEEDTASLMHVSSSPQNIAERTQNNAELIQRPSASSLRESATLVNFNRAGIPLMELVTEPVIRDAETAVRFARELQLLLRTLGASEANLEKGEMRIEANVSVAKATDTAEDRRTNAEDRRKDALILRNSASSLRQSAISTLGTKVEIKNLNSFRSVERAIAFEIARQIALIEGGGEVTQETRGWDETKQATFHQRFKEGSADYRYFPEPDLPKLFLSEIPEFSHETLRASLPELPWERRMRYARTYALRESDAAYLCATTERAAFFDAVAAALESDGELIALATNYIVSDLAGVYAKRGGEEHATLDPAAFAKLIRLVGSGKLSSRGAKDTLHIFVTQGGDPETIAKKHNLIQMHDTEILQSAVKLVLGEERKAVEEYRAGKAAALQYLLGKSMKATKGAGNPAILKDLIIKNLNLEK